VGFKFRVHPAYELISSHSLSIGNAQEQATVNRIIENGIVKFEYGSYHYEISWATVELDEKGSPKPRNFSGFRKLSSDTGNSSQEDIAGEEIVDAEEKSKVLEWFASLTATTSCWILTALGFVVTVGLWIFDKARAHQSEKLSNVVKKAREELEDARKLFRADAEKATSKMFNDMPLREYREAIEEAVRTAVRDYQDPEDAVIKLVGDAAIDFIQPQLVDLGGSLTYYERIVGPQFMANELLERELPRAIKSASSKLSPSRITRGYINALKVAEEQSRIMQQRTDQLEKLRPQEIQLAQAKDAAEQELRIKQRALENYLAEKHDEEDSVSKDYREAIEEQERALKKATETADIFHEAARRAEEQREEAERRHIQEHDRADREAEKIFRE